MKEFTRKAQVKNFPLWLLESTGRRCFGWRIQAFSWWITNEKRTCISFTLTHQGPNRNKHPLFPNARVKVYDSIGWANTLKLVWLVLQSTPHEAKHETIPEAQTQMEEL